MKAETKDLSGTHADQASSDLENQTLRKPSTALDYKVIELALEKSPTGGNARPFEWYWDQDDFIIEHSVRLSAHYLNRNYHASYLLGAGKVAMRLWVNLQMQGYVLQPYSAAFIKDPDQYWIEVVQAGLL